MRIPGFSVLAAFPENFVAHNGGIKGPFGLRAGNWKYITPGGATPRVSDVPGADGARRQPTAAGPHLYDLATDLGETKNLATEKPEKLRAMQELLGKIRGE